MTGAPCRSIQFSSPEVATSIADGSFFTYLMDMDREGYLLSASTPGEDTFSTSEEGKSEVSFGLVPGHAYSLIAVKKLSNGVQLVCVSHKDLPFSASLSGSLSVSLPPPSLSLDLYLSLSLCFSLSLCLLHLSLSLDLYLSLDLSLSLSASSISLSLSLDLYLSVSLSLVSLNRCAIPGALLSGQEIGVIILPSGQRN
jgi:hypothetical protein